MKLDKLNPWNWFKHEPGHAVQNEQIPVQRDEAASTFMAPADTYRDLHRRMDRLFEDAFSSFGFPAFSRSLLNDALPVGSKMQAFKPQVDVSGNSDQYSVKLDLPGMSQDDVSIELHDHTLTITGEKESKAEKDDDQYYCVERSYGSFQRTLSLPEDAAADDIQAHMSDGVLTLTIPRLALEKDDVKRIDIAS